MVREKKTALKGQTSILSFTKGKNSKPALVEDEVVSSSEDDSRPVASSKNVSSETSDLPPIHDIAAIFSDMVARTPEMKSVAKHLQGRSLRIATMCSGTESPLLALEMIRRSIEAQYGVNLGVEHVFSCEIEPFKQAYIERNFQPPILFRDVCELDRETATTAYGAEVPVPGNVDMLVAGTSCVDYSNLNNEKQDISANGESGRTFRGMMGWVKNHRPAIVILENVCSAPWDKIVIEFERIGYSARNARFDTKQYYIPHTRTRGYLVAINEKKSKIPNKWLELVNKMKRPASSTLDAFLLPSDDPRVSQAREKLVRESFNAGDRRTGRTDWNRCESRHKRARVEEELGNKRPFTSWDESGFCKMPDFAWADWAQGQVERVWDLMDISILRAAVKGVDPSFKTQVWNLSQNVDRSIGTNKVGICPCLTPSMIPYITNRGGPMVGLEALSLQGLPIDELLLTRETEDNLSDLAGNAMSSTVVGTCMMAALILGKDMLDVNDAKVEDGDAMEIDQPTASKVEDVGSHIQGEKQLAKKPLDLSTTTSCSFSELLALAERSARLCECEGRRGVTTRVIRQCVDCGSTACERCGGRPEHNTQELRFGTDVPARVHPSEFEKFFTSTFPMCLDLSGVKKLALDKLWKKLEVEDEDEEGFWPTWRDAAIGATNSEFRFVELKRQEVWTAVYRSTMGSLELALHPKQPEWRLFARAKDSEPANSELRRVLESSAVARLVCKRDTSGTAKPGAGLLEGRWEFALPHRTDLKLTVVGVESEDESRPSLVPSWESKLGLQGEELKDRRVYSQLRISVDKDSESSVLERDIAGLYTLFDRCGTANSGLHKKEPAKGETDLPPLYFFLDPLRCADPNEDPYVFSISKSRYEFGETRPIICTLDPKWRQITAVEAKNSVIDAHVSYVWTKFSEVSLRPSHEENATFSVPSASFTIDTSLAGCGHASAVLVCRVPLEDQAGPEWPRGSWVEVDKTHERATYKAISWLIERVRNVEGHFVDWQQVESHVKSTAQDRCERCAPTPPTLSWVKNTKNKTVAIEDSLQAGEYERRLKGRPAPFVTQLKFDQANSIGTLRIGINIPSLLHRALSRLPNIEGNGRVQKAPTLSWRLNTEFSPAAQIHLPKFTLLSNKRDKQHKQPPHFELPLRIEQVRSLEWMIRQESAEVDPFVEEEISEAVISSLGWRAEGRVQREVFVRGGVLADQVGYGKTAITLALIDCTQKAIAKEVAKRDEILGKVTTKATLVIVPPHLTRQWGSEVNKFTGSSAFNTIVVSTMSDWNKQTIKTITKADVVIIASNLLKSEAYMDSLSALSAAGDLPKTAGRYMETCLDNIGEGLKKQVELLRTEGTAAVLKEIEAGRRREQEAAQAVFVQKKRLKGKNYREAAQKEQGVEEVTKPLSTLKVSEPEKPQKSIKKMQSDFIGVVIKKPKSEATREPETSSARSSSPAQDDDSDPVPRKRKAATKTTVIISDDSGDDEPAPAKRPVAGKSVKRPLKRSRDSDDDFIVASDAEDSDVHMSDVADSEDDAISEDSEEDSAPKKSKAKGKAPAAKFKPPKKSASKPGSSKPSTSAATSEDDVMNVDDGAPAKKSKRRKADDKDEKPKKKRREDFDPWKLKTPEVRKDWERMRAPPLEIFHWARKVIDEYTYLEDAPQLPLIARLTADRHWVLSGTPPIHDFSALKTIAAFMNVHLGVDDDGEGKSDRVKKRLREQTSAEKFHSFREVHTLEWHAHRHALGQVFLDRFVRQNVAEIDEIPCSETIKKIVLPAAERAIYLELEHHLRALDMTIKRSKKTESDREKRLAQSLGESKTAEEALLKRCSHFDLDQKDKENAMKACEIIVKERKKQLEECQTDLKTKLQKALVTEKKTPKTSDESLFREFIRHTYQEGLGDEEASKLVLELFDEAGITLKGGSKAQEKSSAAKGKKTGGDPHLTNDDKAKIWAHREETHEIRKVVKELVGRVRSLRYFTVVRDLQKQNETPPELSCPSCGRKKVPISELAVLSSCGHTGCETCVMAAAEKEECIYAGSGKCTAAARVLNVVKGETLGVDDEVRDGRGRHFGLKLEKVVELIKKEIPTDERILIFVQFQDLMKKVGAALKAHKIKYLEIEGSSASRSKTLQAYQDGDDAQVLLLNVMDESASGANLTVANHAIFLSPLLAPSQEIYDACETQAIGRLRRYGQTKHVHIWRFLSTNTIDVEIFEQRTKRKVE